MYTGAVGKLMISTTKGDNQVFENVAYISNWSIEDTMDTIEYTCLGEKDKKKAVGLQGWSGSADGTVCFDAGSSHKALFDAKKAGTPVTVQFYLNDKTKPGADAAKDVYFVGTGYIESLSVDLSAEDKGNISISIAGDGELKLVD